MPRFFKEDLNSKNLIIDGDDARHISRSLRMKPGDSVTVCCRGIDYNCIITGISEDGGIIRLGLIDAVPCASEPDTYVTLFQAVPKSDKLEFITQKTVELGVSRIIPFVSRRCISRPDKKDAAKKVMRLNKISEEAAKQSGRGIIPEITPVMTYSQALEEMKRVEICLMLYEEGGKSLREIEFKGKKSIGLVIGSEGGFDIEEVDSAVKEAGAEPIWLGKRILRCETAPLTALSLIMFLTKNM